MGLFKKKSGDDVIVRSPIDNDSSPVRDFIILLLVIITAPIVFTVSFLTGRIRNPFVVVAVLLLITTGLYYISKSDLVDKKDIKTKIIQQTLEELTPEEKEELRNEISTLRKSVDIALIPKALYPILDVPIDMLNINYLLFMIQSGYIKPSGEGSEFILDSYLHSQHKALQEKSWEALQNINSEAAARVISNYQTEVAQKAEERKRKMGARSDQGIVDDVKEDLLDEFRKLRVKSGH